MLMVHVRTPTAMELLPLLSLCLLTQSGPTFADGNEPSVLVAVQEKSDAILPCSISRKENIEKEVFDWKKDDGKEVFLYADGSYYGKGRTGQDEQFKGRVLHFEDELKNGNASIKIKNTKMADTGSYTCTFPNQQTSNIKLVVDPDPERFNLKDRRNESIRGAASEPSIIILQQTKDKALLQCLVRGASPKPKLKWQDSSGNILPAEEPQVTENDDSYNVFLQTTVSKTDTYRCVATQEEIYHETDTKTHVYINEFPTIWIIVTVLSFVGGGVITILVMKCYKKNPVEVHTGNLSPEDEQFPLDQKQTS
ncbi:butyrophilin subfamily 2 member A2-like [Anabas testudineus]|uniref:butyrophilin subfamily 2 member A2-like n=1 Tax=Anabas testudineus TaxID=64144 RepID=UPI000E4592A2|nr:butyrophilin subfamily 2 member A2-like [Anabas testudineus]